MVNNKITTTITLPPDVRTRAKKYMEAIGLNLSSWISDRITKEMDVYYKGGRK